MEIKVHAHDMGLSPRLESYITEKIDRLDRYLSNIIDANLELHKEGRSNQPVVQLTIRSERGTIFRVEERKQNDFFAAIDVVVDRMYRQLERHKTKNIRKGNSRAGDIPAEAVELPPLEGDTGLDLSNEDTYDVVRRKEVTLNPMYESEAVEQLELLGHDFFVYLDGETGRTHILYKRHDGGYGLLVTKHD
jgi:putative sigma-54 modulation protein